MTTEDTGITHVSGRDVERTGTDAFVFIDLKGWDDLQFETDTLALHRWYEQVAKRVWMSFTSAGQPIQKAIFVVVLSPEMWNRSLSGWRPPDDIAVSEEGFFSVEAWISMNLPVKRSIIVSIVYDIELCVDPYLGKLGHMSNLLALHDLVYPMPASRHRGQQQLYLAECERIYNGDPENWYLKPISGDKCTKNEAKEKQPQQPEQLDEFEPFYTDEVDV